MNTDQLTPTEIEQMKQEDIQVIRDTLTERGDRLTLKNARFVLAVGLQIKPAGWTITDEDLIQLWPEATPDVKLA